jgi:hypothetical protein
MIIIKVELHSAVTGKVQELARMHIINQGSTTIKNPNFGDYQVQTFRGRSKEILDKLTISKATIIHNWRRNDYHVWNLICKALTKMGYTQGH